MLPNIPLPSTAALWASNNPVSAYEFVGDLLRWPDLESCLCEEARHRFRVGGADGLTSAGMFTNRDGCWYRPDSAVAGQLLRQLLATHAGVIYRDGRGREWAINSRGSGEEPDVYFGFHLPHILLTLQASARWTTVVQHAAIWESVRCFELLGHLASLEVEQFGPMISTTAGQLVTALWAAPSVTEADLFPLLADTIGLAGRIGIADFTLPTNRWRFTSLRETPACIALSRQDDQLRIELSPLLLPALEAFGLS